MAKTAFLFPGQGSQYVGMGRDLYEAFPEARACFEAADALLEFPLTQLKFGVGGDADAEAEALKQTDVTQPAIYAHSMAVMAVLEKHGLKPDMTAGHSLGEYSALAAAGAIRFEDGLRIVRLRGQLMAEAGQKRPGTMAAILGLSDEDVEHLCLEASEGDHYAHPANFNAPGQIVVSGDVRAVYRAIALAKERGARRALPLSVSGAFHSPLMDYARDGLARALIKLDIQEPRCPVYLNVTAAPTTTPIEIRERLLEQLMAPVMWAQTLEHMHADGARRFVEVGPGKVLTGLLRRTLGRDLDTTTAGKANELQGLAEAVG